MKIYHIALRTTAEPQSGLLKALSSLGEYREVDWVIFRDSRKIDSLNRHIVSAVSEFQPDVIFCQVQTPSIINASTVRQFGSAFSINWTGDVRNQTPDWMVQLAPYFSTTAFTNMRDVELIKSQGFRSDYLQIGYDDSIFYPDVKVDNVPPIVFMGNHYRAMPFQLSQERFEMVKKLKARYGSMFRCYGFGWQEVDKDWFGVNQTLERKIYNSCSIAINHSHYCLPRYSSDRMLRLVGCGAFCVSHSFPESDAVFKEHEHVRYYDGFENLERLIDYYLDHQDEAQAMRARATKYAKENHTWAKRMNNLLDIWRNK